jgi:hypothetical protein
MVTGKLPQDVDNKDHISSLLACSAFWKKTVFDRACGGISQVQVDALFLALTASQMIQLQPKNKISL